MKKISIEEFERLKDKHLISEVEMKKWWGKDRKEFYLYEPQVLATFSPPVNVKWKQGYQNFIRGLELMAEADPYLIYPSEEKKWPFVIQEHFRGLSSHLDFRYKVGNYLLGWTLLHQIPGEVKKPVLTLEDARRVHKEAQWKIDWEKGTLRKREVKGGEVRYANLRCAEKAPESLEWLYDERLEDSILFVEGVMPPGEVGATKKYPGVFLIVEKGWVEFGAQKDYFHEYFIHGQKLEGKFFVRMLPKDKASELYDESMDIEDIDRRAEMVLPEGVKEERERTPFYWVFGQGVDQTPYVITKEAEKKEWMPPQGISCLPRKIRGNVPKELSYWTEKDKSKALEMRKKLVGFEELGVPKLKAAEETSFGYYRQWWRGPIHVRFGASTEVWYLDIQGVDNFVLKNALPAKTDESVFADSRGPSLPDVGKGKQRSIAPGSKLSPGEKETPSWIENLGEGKALILEQRTDFLKVQLKGEPSGLFIFTKEKGMPFWTITKSSVPFKKSFKPLSLDEEKQVAYYNIFQPEEYDLEGQWVSEEDIWDCVEDLMEAYREGIIKFDFEHTFHDLPKEDLLLFEVWIEKEDKVYGNQKIKKGSLNIGIKYKNPKLWEFIKNHPEIGISPAGNAESS